MKLPTCIGLACSIYVLWIASFVRCENNETDPDAPDYHFQNYVNKLLRSAFINEFNSIMSNKNKEIKILQERIAERDRTIRLHQKKIKAPSSLMEDFSAQNSKGLENNSNLKHKSAENIELKLFMKKRIRALFQKELDKIIREKDAHIYLLNELLAEKERTIKLQKRFLRKNRNEMTPLVEDGMGEPSSY